MKTRIKKWIKTNPQFINYFPFNNRHIYRSGVSIASNGIMLNCSFKCSGKGNKIVLNRGCILRNCSIYIRGSNNTLVVDKDCTIINGTIHFEDDNNAISIGEKTCISGKTELACIEGTQIEIGKDCLFSSGIFFRTGDSHSVTDLQGNRINESKDIRIGNHVWIGQNVIVTKGSIIQDNCIIGVGSIVTRKFEEANVAIAGNPARVIKENVNWDSHRL